MPDETIPVLSRLKNFRVTRDSRGVVTALLDVPGRAQNVFNEDVIFELQRIVGEIEHLPDVRLLLFRSGKPSGFLAGADVHEIASIRSHQTADQIVTVGQKLFDRLEGLSIPTVAAIHGPCLGGGLEFALACRHRIAQDDPRTRFGFPEVELGLLPGWGGTQRLPQRVGVAEALTMILTGRKLSASDALKIGLVDAAWQPEQFDRGMEQFVADRLEGIPRSGPRISLLARLRDRTRLGQRFVLRAARRRIADRGRHYPALAAIVESVESGIRLGREAGVARERERFVDLLFTGACRNLAGLFFQRERARKPNTWLPDPSVAPHPIRRIGVVGAGAMGAGIAQLSALSGFEVVLKDLNEGLVAKGMRRVGQLMAKAEQKGLLPPGDAEARMRAIRPTTRWDSLAEVDLAIEAVPEKEDLKREVFRQLDSILAPEAWIVSNTSALSVGRLAEATERPARVAGLHFFNPVHQMQLVEIVRHGGTGDDIVSTLVELVRRLGKTPLVVADRPGFLVNRILFPYLDEAVRLVWEGAATEQVDRAAKEFGMPMGPLELLDHVGIDVAADVAQTLSVRAGKPGPTAICLAEMAARGWTGMKSGRGFYWHRHGKLRRPARWDEEFCRAVSAQGRGGTSAGPISAAPTGNIERRLVSALILEAARCLEEQVVTEPWMVDLGVVLGTGFAPFRGGPLRLADDLGLDRVVTDFEGLQRGFGPRFTPCTLLRDMRDRADRFYPERAEELAAAEAEAASPAMHQSS